MRFDMVCSFLLLWFLLQRRCCATIARSSGRVLACRVLTSVGWRNSDARRLLVLALGLAAITAAHAAAVAARAAAVAAAAADLAPRVRLTGPSVGAGVDVRCHARSRIVAVSLSVDVGVRTLGAGRVFAACRSGVGSTLGAGACITVTDRVTWVVVCCTLGGDGVCWAVAQSIAEAFFDTILPASSTICCKSWSSCGVFPPPPPLEGQPHMQRSRASLCLRA